MASAALYSGERFAGISAHRRRDRRLDPAFALTYLVLVLIVVSVGGMGSIRSTFAAAILLGVCDTAGKYYVPKLGAFVIYSLMIAILIWRPNGLFGRVAAR